ncbi:MAG: glycoside hydrolase family 127 protein, partial [Candidatus Aminicenantales bacterium]
VNLFIAGTGRIQLPGRPVVMTQETRYPWDGAVALTVATDVPGPFELALRIPGWVGGEAMPTDLYRFLDETGDKPVLKVDGEVVALDIRDGYARIRRGWKAGDKVELSLPMPVRRVLANEAVTADKGRAAIQRGPVVYAVEGVDNDNRVFDLVLPDAAVLGVEFRPDMLNGVAAITGSAVVLSKGAAGKTVETARPFLAVPYFAWANRGPGQMLVWLPRTAAAVRPAKKLDMSVD